MDVKGFSHIYLPSRNAEESIEFYTKILGFKLFRKYNMNGRLSAYVELGGVLLELTDGATNTPDQDGRT
ncbi:MAG: VOC family protein, partial [Chloroflexi bacterium]|nr:VOC family protein [Chloroflexota bacterium]